MPGMSLAEASKQKNYTFSAEQIWRIERGNQALHGRLLNIYKDSTEAVRRKVQENVVKQNSARQARLDWSQAIRNERAFLINRDNQMLSRRMCRNESKLSIRKMQEHVARHDKYIRERARLHRQCFRLVPLERQPTTVYQKTQIPNTPRSMANVFKLDTSRRFQGRRLKPLQLATRGGANPTDDATLCLVRGVATSARVKDLAALSSARGASDDMSMRRAGRGRGSQRPRGLLRPMPLTPVRAAAARSDRGPSKPGVSYALDENLSDSDDGDWGSDSD
jgi:hypothetical protein